MLQDNKHIMESNLTLYKAKSIDTICDPMYALQSNSQKEHFCMLYQSTGLRTEKKKKKKEKKGNS